MVVGDPEPTIQRQKLSLPMHQSPGAKEARDPGGWGETNKRPLCGCGTSGESRDKWMGGKAEGKE